MDYPAIVSYSYFALYTQKIELSLEGAPFSRSYPLAPPFPKVEFLVTRILPFTHKKLNLV